MTDAPLFGAAKRLASRLSPGMQENLKRLLDSYRMVRGTFVSDEPEFARLQDWIGPGDTVLDIGANVGVYTLRLSELVGPHGRVIAFEPIPRTFRLLARNAAKCTNVTLINAAVSATTGAVNMAVPSYYRAQISDAGTAVLSLAIDGLDLPLVSLIKIDVEGHEYEALTGMVKLLERNHPALIVEGCDPQVVNLLAALDYSKFQYAGSPNTVYED